MGIINMEELSVASVRQQIGTVSSIGDNLLLIDDLSTMPWPDSPRRMRCILLALCWKGTVQRGH